MYISTEVPSSQPHAHLVLTSGRKPLGSRGGVFPHSQATLAEGASTPMIQLTPPTSPVQPQSLVRKMLIWVPQ